MLTDEDIVRAVRTIRYSPKRLRNGRHTASVNMLASTARITRDTVYRIAQRGTMSPETADKLRFVLSQQLHRL